MKRTDDEAALVEAAEIASTAAVELVAQLGVMETFVADRKREERDDIDSRGAQALLWQANMQIEAVRHAVKHFRKLYKDVPQTVIELKAKPHTRGAVVKGLRRYRRTFEEAVLFQGSVEFQFSSLKRFMRLAVPETHAGREELEFCLTAATDALAAMKQAVAWVAPAIGAKLG